MMETVLTGVLAGVPLIVTGIGGYLLYRLIVPRRSAS